jgi:hypothetical protein
MDNINAKEVKNFLSNNEVDIFLQLAKNSSESDWGKGGNGFWDGRVLYPEIFKQNKEILDMFKDVGQRIKKNNRGPIFART